MSDSQVEKELKETLIRLDEHQFRHLLTSFGSISREIGSIAVKLESRLTALESELKLIRMEINNLAKVS